MLKQTPLNAAHRAAGARMVDFGGWDMPVNYGSQVDEHHAVRTAAGMFDVSHMRVVDLEGAGARDFLRYALANNVDRLQTPGKALYSCLLKPDGTVIDDLIVYFFREDFFRLVVNAGTADKDIAWLRAQITARALAPEPKLTPRDDLAIIAVQGPRARETLPKALPGAAEPVASLKPFNAAIVAGASADVMVARTGYTGEDGFEIVCPKGDAERLWAGLRAAGVAPCGLGARDTLRLEAGLALYGNDIDDTTTVVEAGLGWIVKADKGEFLGRELLVRQMERGTDRRLVGFEMRGRGIARQGYRVVVDGVEAGRVTSGTRSPTLEKNIGLAYVPTAHAEIGSEIAIEIRDREEIAVVIPTPFYRRPGPGKGHGV